MSKSLSIRELHRWGGKNLLALSLILFLCVQGLAQNKTSLTGYIYDDAGKPLPGAMARVTGAAIGAYADADGKFIIEATSGTALEFSFIGFEDQKLSAAEGMKVFLKESVNALEELVVVGYGTAKKSDLTGAVGSVNEKSFAAQPIKNASEALQGRMAGVTVTSFEGAKLGAGSNIRVRGVSSINFGNDPLWVVDGVIGGSVSNMSDIASIEVLKDASSTAIYGSRGANGVILVTTKKGKSGRANVSFTSDVTVGKIAKTYDLLSAGEYAEALEKLTDFRFSPEDLQAYKSGAKGIDWQKAAFQNTLYQDYKLSISGGSEKTHYYISGNFLDQKAITIGGKLRQYGFRARVDTEVYKWLSVDANISGYQQTTAGNDVDTFEIINYSPAMELTDENGVYQNDPFCSIAANPMAKLKTKQSDAESYVVNGSIDLKFKIIDGLTFTTQGSFNIANSSGYGFRSSKYGPNSSSTMSNSMSRSRAYQNTNNLTYTKSFGSHNLTATAVYEIFKQTGTGVGVSGTDLLSEKTGYWNIGAVKNPGKGSTSYWSQQMLSAFGRVMYNYANKYYATATVRADGSSKFMENKWGWFPSGAIAWDASKETFVKNWNVFDQLKLRASYGVAGNQAIGAYGTLGLLSLENYAYGTGKMYPGYWEETMASPNLTWEKTESYDVGVDLSVLGGRLSATVDWYRKNTNDILFNKTIPMLNGGGSFWANVGKLYSTGVDITIDAHPVQSSDFDWQTTLTASYLRTEVTDLDGEDFLIPGDQVTSLGKGYFFRMEKGKPTSNLYLYKWEGLDENGVNLYRTADGGTSTNPVDDDRILTGQLVPKWTLGWNNTFRYKHWEANVFFRASLGSERLNMLKYAQTSRFDQSKFITSREGYYRNWDVVSNKADAKYASFKNQTTNGFVVPWTTEWLEDASFLRLQNLSLAYTFTRDLTKFADITLGVSAQNLFTITGYSGYDPESISDCNNDTSVGLDYGAYPGVRTFTFSLKLGF